MRDRNFRRRDWSDPKWEEHLKVYQQQRQRNRAFFGVAMAIAGILWLLDITYKINFNWQNNWPFIPIAIGLFLGIKNKFRNPSWWILCLVGVANLVEIYHREYGNYIWPVSLIVAGLGIAFRPRRQSCKPGWKMQSSVSTENDLNIDVTFGGKKEVVTAKDFKGGVISVTFAGCELNLSQADFTEPSAVLDFRVSFGGVEMVVPSHWEIQNEVTSSFGSVEDERTVQTATTNENKKLLILRGNVSFGSIEIKSY